MPVDKTLIGSEGKAPDIQKLSCDGMDFTMLKLFMVSYFGSEKGRQDEVEHLMEMAKIAVKGWMSENKSLQSRIELLEGEKARAKELLRKLTRCHSDCEACPCIHTVVIDFLSSPS